MGNHNREIMDLAKQENLHNQLKALMEQLDIRVVFKALQDAQGSIKRAKRILLVGGSEEGVPDIAPKKAMKTETACEGSDSDAEPPQKSAKIARALSPDDEAIMKQARQEQLHMKLQTLLENPKVAEKQLDTGVVFKALQDASGKVVAAKRALLGA